jgi:hypothetical protein
MASYGMLRRMALVKTDVSEELSASIIRVTRIGELGTTLVITSNRCKLRNITEYGTVHSHRRENLKSYIFTSTRFLSSSVCYLTALSVSGL